MRVPTYKRQTKMTAKTGALNFSVQASPGALSAGSTAMAQFGEQAMNVTLNYMERQLKMERSTDVNARENKLRENSTNLITEANKQNFKTTAEANTYFDKKWKPIASNAVKGITDRVVGPIINEKINDLRSIALNDFNKVSRLKIIDYGKSEALKLENNLIDKISTSSGTALVESQTKLWGKDGLYDQMVIDGLITLEIAEKRKLASKSKASRLTVNKELSAAAYGQDSNAASLIAQQLFDPKKYPELTAEARVTLQKQASTLATRLENQAARAIDKTTKKNDLLIKKTQLNTHRNLIVKLDNNEMVTLQKIETLYGDNVLNLKQYENIRKRIIEGDEVGSDQSTVLNFRNEIYDAQDKFEIDTIVEKYEKNLGKDEPISFRDFQGLRDFAEGQKAKTPRALETKRLRSLIGQNVGSSGGIQISSNSVSESMLAADALDTFDRIVDDKDVDGNKRDVREVYNEVIEQIRDAKKKQGFLSLSSKSKEMLGDFSFSDKTESEVTTKLNTLKQEIVADTTRFTQIEKAIEFETIKLFSKNYRFLANK
tara:strand:- start:226 stop:1857 length:1632 start_codon:yes stop_codon:yes gene_type:complete